MPLNLANGVEATAEIILKVAGQGAIYLRCTEMEDDDDDSSILMHSVFDNKSRLIFSTHCLSDKTEFDILEKTLQEKLVERVRHSVIFVIVIGLPQLQRMNLL